MGLPVELRCEIYKYLLTAERGALGVISSAELKHRAVLSGLGSKTSEGLAMQRGPAAQQGIRDPDGETVPILDDDGEGAFLLYVAILRVNSEIYNEAKNIIYEQNTFSVTPSLESQSEPLHCQFPAAWKLSKIRYLRLDMHENYEHGWPQSRSYGIWSTFLHLPALRELRISIILGQSSSVATEVTWDFSSFCAKTVRNIFAAVPKHVKVIETEARGPQSTLGEDGGRRYATEVEMRELFADYEDMQGSDARIWLTEMLVLPARILTQDVLSRRNSGQLVVPV